MNARRPSTELTNPQADGIGVKPLEDAVQPGDRRSTIDGRERLSIKHVCLYVCSVWVCHPSLHQLRNVDESKGVSIPWLRKKCAPCSRFRGCYKLVLLSSMSVGSSQASKVQVSSPLSTRFLSHLVIRRPRLSRDHHSYCHSNCH